MVGGIVLAMALAEGTANDWLPLVMVDGYGLDAALGSAVSTIGYLAFLAGPPVLGFAGEAMGLRGALLLPMACVLLSVLLTPAARPRVLEHLDDGSTRTLSRAG